jgi:hypothetical protein
LVGIVRALEAEAVLLRRLQDLGVSIERRGYFNIGAGDAARQALDVFFAFTTEAIDEPEDADGTSLSVDPVNDGDLLLFETFLGRALPPPERPYWGGSDDPVQPMYELSFTRQFSFHDDDGEYHGMNAVSLTIQHDPASSLTGLPDEQIWGGAGPDGADAWREQVTATPAFSAALATEPALFYIVQSPI